MALDALLGALSAERVLVACKVEPKQPSGTNKIPVDPHTGFAISAHDPALRMYPYEWLALPPHPYLLGVVLTEDAKRFCIDLDHAYDPATGEWSAYALKVLAAFPTAYREMSHSGTGLHIHGKYTGELPPHRTRRAGLPGLEVYTRLRFILQTGEGSSGDYDADCTAALVTLIVESFEPAAEAVSREWTTEAAPGYNLGRFSDAELLEYIAGRRPGPGEAFGNEPQFTDVWNGTPKARDYFGSDDSALDMSLAAHLAYYTGKNCERVLALMQGAPIARDKWQRENYLQRTVLRAVSTTDKYPGSDTPAATSGLGPVTAVELADYVNAAPLPPLPPGVVSAPLPVTPSLANITNAYLTTEHYAQLFVGCYYVRDVHHISMPDGSLLDEKRFNAHFGHAQYQMRPDGTAPVKHAWTAFLDNECMKFPRVDGLVFDPTRGQRELVQRDGLTFLNTWVPVAIDATPGDVQPFLNHLAKLLPDARDQMILLSYFAFCVQYIGRKSSWAVFIQGVEGNGKSFLSQCLKYCIGQRYSHDASTKQLDNRFNDVYTNKLLVTVEDVFISEARTSVWEALKPMITESRLEIEYKNGARVARDVCFNFLLNSNHKDALRKTRNERRICPFYCAQQSNMDLRRDGLTKDYFKALWGWAQNGGNAALLHYLRAFPIPDEFNPAVDAIVAPITTSLDEALRASRTIVEQTVADAIEARQDGFRGGFIYGGALANTLHAAGLAKFTGANKRVQLMAEFGYYPHPGLPGGRPIEPIGGTRHVLYVKLEHPTLSMLEPTAIVAAYRADNNGAL